MAQHHGGAVPLHGDLQLRLAEGVMRGDACERRQRLLGRQHALFTQDVGRDLERGVGRRNAAIDCALHQRLFDLLDRHAAADARLAVQLELFPARERHRHAEHEQAAGRGVEPGSAPDVVPGIARDQVLELGIERRRVVQ